MYLIAGYSEGNELLGFARKVFPGTDDPNFKICLLFEGVDVIAKDERCARSVLREVGCTRIEQTDALTLGRSM